MNAAARTFTIIGDADAEVDIAGAWKFLSAGSGFGTSGDNFLATALSAAAGSHFVYINLERDGATCEIVHGTSLPLSDDDTQVLPLWKLTVGADPFPITAIKDMRYTKQWVAGA